MTSRAARHLGVKFNSAIARSGFTRGASPAYSHDRLLCVERRWPWVVDADIRSFFEALNGETMLEPVSREV
jgi:hypothetical protein